MFKNIKNEYSVQTAPLDQPELLQNLLNQMSSAGWELYTLHEAESSSGKSCYNCIFVRDIDEDNEEQEIVGIDDFKAKMEKMYDPSDEPYQKCRQLQRKIKDKQQRVSKIKSLLDSTQGEIEHERLNEEILNGLKDLKELKTKLIESIDPDKMYDKVFEHKLSILLSDELTMLVSSENESPLVSQTVKLRQEVAEKLGYVIPSAHFAASEDVEGNEFVIQIRGIEIIRGFAYPGYRCFFPGESNIARKPKDAIESVDPVTNEKVFWIESEKTRDFWEKGLSAEEVISKTLEHTILKYVDDLLDYSDVNKYLEIVGEKNIYLIENLIPEYLSIGDLRYIFAQLIKERIPLKDIVYIFERLNDYADEEDKEDILEQLRISLSKQICKSVADKNGNIYGIIFEESVINELEKELLKSEEALEIDMKLVKKLLRQINSFVQSSDVDVSNIALVVPAPLRHLIFIIFEHFILEISVIAREEISKEFTLAVIGNLEL